jgi:hypothetical protein
MRIPFSQLDTPCGQTRSLDLAILMQTLVDLKDNNSRIRAISVRYIFSDEHKRPFSFISICRRLGYSPERFRKCLVRIDLSAIEKQALFQKILRARAQGIDVRTLADRCGVPVRTMWRWLKQARERQHVVTA